MEWRLDKEGREYHHYEDFCKLYRAEILNLNRMIDTLMRNGMLPSNLLSMSNVIASSLINQLIIISAYFTADKWNQFFSKYRSSNSRIAKESHIKFTPD